MQSRLISIDALRAVIMVLMIFVNDLWSLVNIPDWLGHVSADTDGMGLADIVFPAFLFIVGLSIPYAIRSRKNKGHSTLKIFFHITERTVALLIMGVFLVNTESYAQDALLLPQVWMILLILAFFLIWMDYKDPSRLLVRILRGAGILLLIVLALVYKSNEGIGPTAMKTHWWGILGLIGWAYFISSCVFLFSKGKLLVQILAFLILLALCSAASLDWQTPNGGIPAFSMAGVVASLCYRQLTPRNKYFWISLSFFAIILILFGLLTRPLWGISKIHETPSWVGICSGVSIICFLLLVFIMDIKGKTAWYKPIKPAGTSTLTAYLLPYIHYAILGIFSLQLPVLLRTGALGLGKSLLYALLIVIITGLLEKKNLRLKI